jgi:hypothetical protein
VLGEYLDLTDMKWQKAGKDCIMRSFLTLMFQLDKIKKAYMGEACITHGRNAYKISVGKPEWKRPPGKPRCR